MTLEEFAVKRAEFLTALSSHLVAHNVSVVHGGVIPEDREKFIEGLVDVHYPWTDRLRSGYTFAELDAERTDLAQYLREALETFELQKKTRWKC